MKASHLDYYRYQAQARKIFSAADVERVAVEKSYLYDRIVLPRLKHLREGPIVEAACGHGSFLYWLRSRGFQDGVGVDSSEEQGRLAREAGLCVEVSDINAWLQEQPESSIGAIVGIDLIEHLGKDDFIEFLRHCQRVLKEGGLLILRYPNGDSPLVGLNLFNGITHVWTYTSTAMRSVGAMCGFSSADFVDEGSAAIRDHRWLKVPVSWISQQILRTLLQAASREKILSWSPHVWSFLQR